MNDSATEALERYDGQEPETLTPTPETPASITPAQARVESVAALLDAAYKNASLLKLTPEEAQALEEPFPDEAFRLGAGGDPSLLYIEHAYLRQRLNKVLGVGAAVPIRRREWAEEFSYFKDGKTKKGIRIYVDLALLVRGCLVGEAIGDAVYYPDNAKTNYSDALESAKSNAFRRCAKEFGVGLQAWMKGWCEGWKDRNGSGRSEKTYTVHEHQPAPKNASEVKLGGKKVVSGDVLPTTATVTTRDWAMNHLLTLFSDSAITNFLTWKHWSDTTGWNLEHVPTTKTALNALSAEIGRWLEGSEPPPEDELPTDIASVIITVPRKGTAKKVYLEHPDTIGSLYVASSYDEDARKRLFGLANSWKPEPYEWNGKTYEPTKQDWECREGLDAFLKWEEQRHGATQPDLIP